VIIVEECMRTGGIGAELVASISDHFFDELDAPVLRMSSEDIPTPYNGKLQYLTIIQPPQIAEAIERMVDGKV
jgi:pyruvate dehydrogenase E1 component beta subunit